MDISRAAFLGDALWFGGRWLGYGYLAWVSAEPSTDGIDPVTLHRGQGRVVELTLYEFLAPGVTGLHRVAHFKRRWHYGRRRYAPLLEELVASLELGRLP